MQCSLAFLHLHTWVCVVVDRRFRERRFVGGSSKPFKERFAAKRPVNVFMPYQVVRSVFPHFHSADFRGLCLESVSRLRHLEFPP